MTRKKILYWFSVVAGVGLVLLTSQIGFSLYSQHKLKRKHFLHLSISHTLRLNDIRQYLSSYGKKEYAYKECVVEYKIWDYAFSSLLRRKATESQRKITDCVQEVLSLEREFDRKFYPVTEKVTVGSIEWELDEVEVVERVRVGDIGSLKAPADMLWVVVQAAITNNATQSADLTDIELYDSNFIKYSDHTMAGTELDAQGTAFHFVIEPGETKYYRGTFEVANFPQKWWLNVYDPHSVDTTLHLIDVANL